MSSPNIRQGPDNRYGASHGIGILFNLCDISLVSYVMSERSKCTLPTIQAEFSLRFVSSPNVRQAPDSVYGEDHAINVLFNLYLIPYVSYVQTTQYLQ